MKTLNILRHVVAGNKTGVTFLLASVLALALLGFYRPAVAGQTSPSAPAAPAAPEATCPAGGQCFADVPPGSPFYEYANNLYVQDIISGYPCGGAGEPCDDQRRPYYRPSSDVTRAQMTKFVDLGRKQPGIRIDTSTHTRPIYSRSSAPYGTGVTGESIDGIGVSGFSETFHGVSGYSYSGLGVIGYSHSGFGVYGSTNNGIAVYGSASIGSGGYAGDFNGNVRVQSNLQVTGNVSKGGGSFKIDHPLDPENKYLYHSFVESPDMMNVYNGNVTLDANGEAVVQMPEWFEALNRDFRYQLTTIGGFAPVYIAGEVKESRFKIAGGKQGLKVSWQVTGIRQDPFANKHRIPVEEDKPQEERGLYLHPDVYGQPESKQIGKIDLPQPPSRPEEPGIKP